MGFSRKKYPTKFFSTNFRKISENRSETHPISHAWMDKNSISANSSSAPSLIICSRILYFRNWVRISPLSAVLGFGKNYPPRSYRQMPPRNIVIPKIVGGSSGQIWYYRSGCFSIKPFLECFQQPSMQDNIGAIVCTAHRPNWLLLMLASG